MFGKTCWTTTHFFRFLHSLCCWWRVWQIGSAINFSTKIPLYPASSPAQVRSYTKRFSKWFVSLILITWHLLLSFLYFYRPALLCSAHIQARLTADCIEDFTNSSLTVMVVWYSHALKQQRKVTVATFLWGIVVIVSGRMPCPHAHDASFYWCVAMVFKVKVYAMTLWFLTWVGTVMESMMHALSWSMHV